MLQMIAPLDKTIKLSVVVPCYNEEEVIDALLARLVPACEKQVGKAYEILLTNDASTDNTWRVICDANEKNANVIGIDLARNHGHQLGLTAGLAFARGSRVFILDADLQDPPELLADMWQKMDDGADVVYGQRRTRNGETAFKKYTAKWFYRLLDSMTHVKIPKDTGDFRLMSRQVLEALQSMPEQQRFIRGMVAYCGYNQEAISYDRDARFAGETKYPLKKMIKLALDAITSFSVRPLQIAYIIAFFTGIFAGIALLWTLYVFITEDTIPGWTSLMAVILMFSAIQMFILAIFGEYLGRVYMEAKQRPLYNVREVTPRSKTK